MTGQDIITIAVTIMAITVTIMAGIKLYKKHQSQNINISHV